ncbi:inner nuclear membrane protein Src1p [Diutina rugosa]
MAPKRYLQDGFDPGTLRVSELRKILKELEIKHAPNAKKKELVAIFNDQVTPKLSQLREKHDQQTSDESQSVDTSTGGQRVVKTKKLKRRAEADALDKRVAKLSKHDTSISADNSPNNQRVSNASLNFDDSSDDEFIESLTQIVKPVTTPSSVKKENSFFTNKTVKGTPAQSPLANAAKEFITAPKKSTPLKSTPSKSTPSKSTSTPSKSTPSKSTPSKSIEEEASEFDKARNEIVSSSLPTRASNASSPGPTHQTPPGKTKDPVKPHSSNPYLMETPNVRSPTIPSVGNANALNERSLKFTRRPIVKGHSATVISDDNDENEAEVEDRLGNENYIKALEAENEVEFESDDSRKYADSRGSSKIEEPMSKLGSTTLKHDRSILHPTPVNTSKKVATVKKTPSRNLVQDIVDSSDEDYETDNDDADTNPLKRGIPRLLSIFVWTLFIMAWAFGVWYRQQIFVVGYCDHAVSHTTFGSSSNSVLRNLGKWLDNNARPQCVPCPQHARCFPNLELGCFEEFTEYVPWNNWLFPTNKRCVSDTKRAEKIVLMIENAKDLLREKNARRQCGKCTDDIEAGITLSDLHDFLLEMKAPYISLEEFEELWNSSIIQLEKEKEIIVRQTRIANHSSRKLKISRSADEGKDDNRTEKVFRSTSLRNLSLGCQLRNSVVGSIARHKVEVLFLVTIVILVKLINWKLVKFREEKTKLDIIYKDVLKRLYGNAKRAKTDPDVIPYIGSVQLRDIILANEQNLKRRVQLWNKVITKVEANTNINSKVIEDHGEIFKVWQWVSDVDHIDHQWVSPKGIN